MTIQRIPVQPAEIGLLPELPPMAGGKAEGGTKFSEVLERFMGDVNSLQQHAAETQKGAMDGTVQDIHEIMIAGEEAGIAFELMLELRNKLLDAYKELMRMQV